MGYHASLDIELKSSCCELSAVRDTLENPPNNQASADFERIREALLTLINERKEIHANYEDLMTCLYQIDVLARRQQRRLLHEESRYLQLSLFDSAIDNSH